MRIWMWLALLTVGCGEEETDMDDDTNTDTDVDSDSDTNDDTSVAAAGTLYDDDYEGLSVDGLGGQDGWAVPVADATLSVDADGGVNDSRYVKFLGTTGQSLSATRYLDATAGAGLTYTLTASMYKLSEHDVLNCWLYLDFDGTEVATVTPSFNGTWGTGINEWESRTDTYTAVAGDTGAEISLRYDCEFPGSGLVEGGRAGIDDVSVVAAE